MKKIKHVALIKPTPLETIQAKGRGKGRTHLPVYSTQEPNKVQPQTGISQKMNAKMRMSRSHARVPKLPKDKIPPCDTCNTAACCSAFVVGLTKDEYDSGLYGDSAIEITEEITKQYANTLTRMLAIKAPNLTVPGHLLEGKIGEPCPFLEGTKCGIYNQRPLTCRMYTCVGDSRITDEMRQGTEDDVP